MCLHTELSTELYEANNLVFNLLNRTLGNSNLNIYLAILYIYNLNISSFKQFHKNRFITKSNDRMSEAFNGQASRPYIFCLPITLCSALFRKSGNFSCSHCKVLTTLTFHTLHHTYLRGFLCFR